MGNQIEDLPRIKEEDYKRLKDHKGCFGFYYDGPFDHIALYKNRLHVFKFVDQSYDEGVADRFGQAANNLKLISLKSLNNIEENSHVYNKYYRKYSVAPLLIHQWILWKISPAFVGVSTDRNHKPFAVYES